MITLRKQVIDMIWGGGCQAQVFLTTSISINTKPTHKKL